jgi:hypothetical protein
MEDEPQFTQEDLQALLATPGGPRPTGQPAAATTPNLTSSPEQGLSQEDLVGLGHTPDPSGVGAEEAARQYGRGTIAGAIETAPAVAGALYGARFAPAIGLAEGLAGAMYGSRFAPVLAPFMGPAALAATTGVGFFAGLLAGKPLSEILVSAPEDQEYVPYYEGGKTFGNTIAFAPVAFSLPPAIGTRLGPYISRIGESARKYPKSYLLGEATYGLSSSMGTVLSEEVAPGEAGTRFAAELTFGMLNPLRLVSTLTSQGAGRLKSLWQMRTREGRAAALEAGSQRAQDEATRRLIQILEEQGEDIPALIKALDEPLPGGPSVGYPVSGQITGPTSAQKTGSVSLSQLEAALGNLDQNFAAELNEQGRQALLAYTKVVNRLQEAGSPEALQVAAELRQQFFDNAVNNRLDRALARAGEKISKITKDTPAARAQIGQIVRDEVEVALENSRKAERFYWETAEREASRPAGQVRIRTEDVSPTLLRDVYQQEAASLQQSLRRARGIDFNNARQVSRVTGIKAISIAEFIKQGGGIADVGGELAARDIVNRRYPGLVRSTRQTPGGTVLPSTQESGIDAVRERLFDAGYFPGKRSYSEITFEEIADALEQDLSGNKFWQGAVREKLSPFFAEREALDSWAASGIDPGMSVQDIAARMMQLDEAARREGGSPIVSTERFTQRGVKVIPRPRVVAAENTVRAYLERVSQIGPALVDSMVPADVRRIMESMGIGEEAIRRYRAGKATKEFAKTGRVHFRYLPDKKTLSKIKPADLINYRSNLLTLARQSRGRGDVADASFYSYLAESMLDDLSKLDNPAYDKAREFSNALNNVFTRTFANELLGTTATGANRYPSETLVDDAFGVGADLVGLRMREIETAVGFMRDRLAKAAAEAGPRIAGDQRLADEAQMLQELAQVSTRGVASIQDAQNRVLRLLASKATFIDPKTSALRLNSKQLNKFVAENKPLLDQLGITGDLTNAVQAENVLRSVLEQNSVLNSTVRNQTAFAQILGFENPTNAISSALRSRFPMRSMARIARLAQRGGPGAMDGLRSSIYDYAFTKATGGTDVLDPQKFKDAFFKPFAKDQPALADILRTQGIVTPQELNNIRQLTNQMMRIEDAMKNRVAIENVSQGADVVTELAMRVIGSKIGTAAASGGPGSLIAASAGSKAVRQIFDKMPMMMVRKTMQRAVQDPALMSLLLRRATTQREKFQLAKSLHAYLLASGLTYATYEPPPEASIANQGGPSQRRSSASGQLQSLPVQRPRPPAPTTRGVPGVQPSGSGAPTGGGGGGASPPATQSRMMLQQLFPNDEIMGAAALQAGMPPTG